MAKDEWFQNANKSDTWHILVTVFIFAYYFIFLAYAINYSCYVATESDGTVTHNNIFGILNYTRQNLCSVR